MLIFLFCLAMIALYLQSTLDLYGTFLCFSPWIAYTLLKCPLSKALWLSAIAGMVVDFLSDQPMGLHAVNYTITTALLSRFSKHFLVETPLHLAVYTSAVSFVSTWFHLFFLFLFDRRVPFTGKWIFSDILGMPIFDGVYALVWFAFPLYMIAKLRRYWMLFWLKRKNPSPTLR